MPYEFEFCFLGRGHMYVATMAEIGSTGGLQSGAKVPESLFFNLPKEFRDEFNKHVATSRRIHDMRGHDYLSFMAHISGEEGYRRTSIKSRTLWNENEDLRSIAEEDTREGLQKGVDLTASLGPNSGACFADNNGLDYRASKALPIDLTKVIHDRVTPKGYRKAGIWDVAINAHNGWVIQFNKGTDFETSKQFLPRRLVSALERARKRGTSIFRLYLNHQHADEYLVLFRDGVVYANLHKFFEKPLRDLLTPWSTSVRMSVSFRQPFRTLFKKRDNDSRELTWWNFDSAACTCTEETMKMNSAIYYSRRGQFHLTRGNYKLAHSYLREAHRQSPENEIIRGHYLRSLKARQIERNDPVLKQKLTAKSNALTLRDSNSHVIEEDAEAFQFRTEYMSEFPDDDGRLWDEELQEQQARDANRPRLPEWSYEMARRPEHGPACEIDETLLIIPDGTNGQLIEVGENNPPIRIPRRRRNTSHVARQVSLLRTSTHLMTGAIPVTSLHEERIENITGPQELMSSPVASMRRSFRPPTPPEDSTETLEFRRLEDSNTFSQDLLIDLVPDELITETNDFATESRFLQLLGTNS